MPVSLWTVISRLSIVSSPPTTIVGRRIRTQRWSIFSSATICSPRGQGQFLVATGIEEADDLAPHADRAGNPDARAVGGRDPFGDAGLAVAGRAVQEEPLPGRDGAAQAAEHLAADRQVGEGAAEALHPRFHPAQRLRGDTGAIVAQRDGHGRRSNCNATADCRARCNPRSVIS